MYHIWCYELEDPMNNSSVSLTAWYRLWMVLFVVVMTAMGIFCTTVDAATLREHKVGYRRGYKHSKKWYVHPDSVWLTYQRIFIIYPGEIYVTRRLYTGQGKYYVYTRHMRKIKYDSKEMKEAGPILPFSNFYKG